MVVAPDARCTLTDVQGSAVAVPALCAALTGPDGRTVEAPLGTASITAGSGADCDLVVADKRVSRCHCRLTLTERGIRVQDLGSKNGTLVSGLAVVDGYFSPGVVLTIGGSRLVVRVAGRPEVISLHPAARFGEAYGGSLVMRALFARLARAAASSETILLLGESGTGKEVLARAVHDASGRKAGPFVVFDCSAVAPSLVEDELFGHAKGAFTGAQAARPGLFEEADGGTLFIDEIGELPLELQPKLLRALESRQVRRIGADARSSAVVDCRVVAATHRDLRARVAEGKFRTDLYYRLQVIEAVVPPLRDRKEDIPLLVERFLSAHVPPRRMADLPPGALAMLVSHDWPGNVRELRNAVARFVVLADVGELSMPSPERNAAGDESADLGALVGLPMREARSLVVERFERAYLRESLRRAGGNVLRAAAAIGVSRQMVYRLMERYGIERNDG